jgi:hypothetical protein
MSILNLVLIQGSSPQLVEPGTALPQGEGTLKNLYLCFWGHISGLTIKKAMGYSFNYGFQIQDTV